MRVQWLSVREAGTSMFFGGIGERRSSATKREKLDRNDLIYVVFAAGASCMTAIIWLASSHLWR